MTFTVRPPSSSDAENIADLHVSTWKESYSHLLPGDYFDEKHIRMRHTMWNHILGDPRDEWSIRVAERAEEIVGFAMAGPSLGAEGQDLPRGRQLYSIYVARAWHGAGVGQALLDATLGAGAAMTWVAQQNPRAITFYRRNGFELDGAEQTDPGAPKILSVRMVR